MDDLISKQYKAIGQVNIPKNLVPETELTRLRRQVERITRLAQEFAESPNIHEAIADNGMTVADGFQEAFKHALAAANKISKGGEIRQGDASNRKDEDGEQPDATTSPTHTREELVEVMAKAHSPATFDIGSPLLQANELICHERAIDALIAIGAVRLK